VAAHHQHAHHHRDLPDGVPHQATQNREAEAIQLKLDELILAIDSARDELIDSENLTEQEQLKLHKKYLAAAERARKRHARTWRRSRRSATAAGVAPRPGRT
jgi:low affinity Fe/Cu permease